MPEKRSVIRCPKCGSEPNIITDICLQCGAALEKKCGGCGFSNSVEKNYCDQCGDMLTLAAPRQPPRPPPPPPPAQDRPAAPAQPPEQPRRTIPHFEMESMQEAVDERGDSFRHRHEQPAKPPTSTVSKTASGHFAIRTAGPAVKKSGLKKLTGPALGLVLLAALAIIFYLSVMPFVPRLRLTMTAKTSLSYLSERRYEKAYELLSTNSKAVCTLEEYVTNNKEYYEKVPRWQFRDAQVFSMTKTAAVIRYQLKEEGGDWKNDYISFVMENGRWTRPYIWILFQPIDEAMARRDFVQALFLSQKLYLTDPVDPRASGYLCASEFFMGLYEKSVESCSRTVNAAASYPVGYTPDELYWFNLYYADSLSGLERDHAALDEYGKMLNLPALTADQQCPIFLNRANVYVHMKDYEKGMADLMQAEKTCTRNPSKDDTAKRMVYMGGGATQEAIAFAKNSRLGPGAPPFGMVRRQNLEALEARLGPKNAKYLPRDLWLAVHLSGPEYRVFLRQEALNPATKKREMTDVFVFFVNLWTRQGKVEKAPTPGASPDTLKK